MIGEFTREALRNLRRHKLRSFLTALGIIFGIASVMSMVSTGEGARAAILAQIEELGIRNIIVNAKKPPETENVQQASTSNEERSDHSRQQTRHRPMGGTNGHRNGGTSGRRNGTTASPKQIGFIRSLGTAAGLSYRDLADLAQESFGTPDLQSLSKRQASALIDRLREE